MRAWRIYCWWVRYRDLPRLVEPAPLRDGHLLEVMPEWRFRPFDLSVVHLGSRHISRAVRLFKDVAVERAPMLFAQLPTWALLRISCR